MAKIKLAQYWTSSCGGCDVAVLDLAEKILRVTEVADLVFWPIALDFKEHHVAAMPDGSIDVCLFNGAIRNGENQEMAKLLRRKSKILVAFGSCAHQGGIPGLANFYSKEDILKHVYLKSASTDNAEAVKPNELWKVDVGELKLPAFFAEVRPLDRVVPVDYYMPGCPPVVEQVAAVVEAIAAGKLPPAGSVIGAGEKTLCDECPREKGEKHLTCFRSIATYVPDPAICLLEQGLVCCGPATRSGCGALCTKANMPCRGCYGPAPGVVDMGAKLISTIAATIESEDPAVIGGIVDQLEDPAGTFYRFGLPGALLTGALTPSNGQKE